MGRSLRLALPQKGLSFLEFQKVWCQAKSVPLCPLESLKELDRLCTKAAYFVFMEMCKQKRFARPQTKP